LGGVSNSVSGTTLTECCELPPALWQGDGRASLTPSSPQADRPARATNAFSNTAALAAELERSGEDLAWRVYRLSAEESAALAGNGDPLLLIEEPGAHGGWVTRSSFLFEGESSKIGLAAPRGERVRAVFLGPHELLQASGDSRGAAGGMRPASITHNRHGDYMEALDPAAGRVAIDSGDTLSLAYERDGEASASTTNWFLLFARQGRAQGPSSRRPMVAETPKAFALIQNRPNPFSSATTIRFDLPRGENVRLDVFDTQGRRVARLADGWFPAGFHAVEWSRTSESGSLAPGVYLYRIEAGEFRAQKKMTLLP
jgi:hypothetical protein